VNLKCDILDSKCPGFNILLAFKWVNLYRYVTVSLSKSDHVIAGVRIHVGNGSSTQTPTEVVIGPPPPPAAPAPPPGVPGSTAGGAGSTALAAAAAAAAATATRAVGSSGGGGVGLCTSNQVDP
jgi:hypothetical protein